MSVSAARGPLLGLHFADVAGHVLQASDLYAAVYAAGGGKRNMANFVKSADSLSDFRPGDIYVVPTAANIPAGHTAVLFVCR